MKVFVTGATGWVGSVVVNDLLKAGHSVIGLSRSEEGAKSLQVKGVQVHKGDLTDIPGLCKGAENADAVIHTAFNHDFSKFLENCETDYKVIRALGAVLKKSDRPFAVTSGIGVLSSGAVVTEDIQAPTGAHAHPRTKSELAVREIVEQGVRAMAIRLPPSVHGKGDHGFVPRLIDFARTKGVAGYLGDGSNKWPAVHRLDAASLFRLAIEKGQAGHNYHAIGDDGILFRDIIAVIGKNLGVPVKSQDAAFFEWFAPFAAMNCPASSERTRKELGWQPKEIGLLADLNENYFSK